MSGWLERVSSAEVYCISYETNACQESYYIRMTTKQRERFRLDARLKKNVSISDYGDVIYSCYGKPQDHIHRYMISSQL